jgi:raffinose/stachyose/melibiose transport system permease protein
MSTLIYKDAFTLGEFGYSIALAVVLTIIVAVVSSGQYLVLARNERAAS